MVHKYLRAVRQVSLGAVLGTAFSAGSAGAVQGGNPADPNSCYSDCGDVISPGVQNCYCDTLCDSKGDCCADKHEWCAPAAAKPFCSLVDEKQKTETAGGGSQTLICGTDLGYTFVHNNRIEMLFGDTWEYATAATTTCNDPGDGGRGVGDFNDDSQARMPNNLARPAWVPNTAAGYTTGADRTCGALAGAAAIPLLQFDKKPVAGSPSTYQQIRLKRQPGNLDIELGLVNTPTTGFSDGLSAYAMFVAAPNDEAFPYQINKHVYVARRRGEANTTDRTTYDTIADLGRIRAAGGTTRFTSVSSSRISALKDAAHPAVVTNYDTPLGPADSELLIWGRGDWKVGEGVSPSTNALYLMRVHIPVTGIATWSPVYFNGNDASGMPLWTSTAPGQPMLSSDFRMANHFDVKWIREINKWVLLYGGDVTDYFDPPTTMDQPRHGAIHMRTADSPGGPWSRPTPLMWREGMGRYYQCDAYDDTNPMGCDRKTFPPPTYPTSDWEPLVTGFTGASPFQDAACQSVHPRAAQTPNLNPLSPFCPFLSQRGNLYAPELLPTWTRTTDASPGGLVSTTIYFSLSTWYPYDVILAAADLNTPRVTYPLQMQVRQASSGKMVGGSGATPVFSTTAGGTNGGLVAFQIDKDGGVAGDKMKVGDVVVLRHVNDSSKQLAVVASAPGYVANTSPAPSTSKWTITSPTLPNGTLVTPGTTSIRLKSVSNPSLFLKSAGSPAQPALGAADSTADYRFGYFCQAGDTCAR